jgi:hypothetical protein
MYLGTISVLKTNNNVYKYINKEEYSESIGA